MVRVLHERREQLELERGQLHVAALDDDAPLRVVDLDELVSYASITSDLPRVRRSSAWTRASSSWRPKGFAT